MTIVNLASVLESSAAAHPDREAIVFGRQRITYRELERLASQCAHVLVASGVMPGDNVALSCPNVPFFTVAYFGILKAGGTVVPLNVLSKGREIAYYLEDSEAKAFLCFEGSDALPTGAFGLEGFQQVDSCKTMFTITADPTAGSSFPGIEPLGRLMGTQPVDFASVATDEDETAVILYTSGTTGQPKGAELRHRNIRDNILANAEIFEVDATQPDRVLCVLPLFHTFGQVVCQNTTLAVGATMVLQPRFEPGTALEIMLEEDVTFFAGVPTMYWQLLGALEDGYDVERLARNLRLAISGGAPLPGEVHHEFEKRFGISILEGYGLSETSPVVSFSRIGEQVRVGSIGLPIPGVAMRLVDQDWNDVTGPEAIEGTEDATSRGEARMGAIGEIAVKGHNVMKGYYRRPKATAEAMRDGWLRTGDLAWRDADGWYYIVDRAKEMVIRGGFNVYPREVEEVMIGHQDVSLCAVIGVPH